MAGVISYRVEVTRDGQFWLIEVPELRRFTQARNLREVEVMARDLVAVMTGVSPDSVDIDVRLELPAEVREHLVGAARARSEEAEARAKAAAELRAAALALKRAGLTMRELGSVLGVSYQRASQLTAAQEQRAAG